MSLVCLLFAFHGILSSLLSWCARLLSLPSLLICYSIHCSILRLPELEEKFLIKNMLIVQCIAPYSTHNSLTLWSGGQLLS